MGSVTRSILRGMVALAALGLGQAAHAASTYYFELAGLNASGATTFTMGTWSLVFSSQTLSTNTDRGCYYTSSSGGSCGNVEIKAIISRGVLELDFYRIASASGNPPHAQSGDLLTGASNGTNRDLYLNFQVKTPASAQKLQSASLAITGSSTSQTNLSATEYLCSSSVSPCTSGGAFANIATATGSTVSYTLTSAQQAQALNIKKDLFSTGSSLNITTMTQRYVSNPEPVSLSVLGVGAVGLALARRRRGGRKPQLAA